jgi:hypothetical protein
VSIFASLLINMQRITSHASIYKWMRRGTITMRKTCGILVLLVSSASAAGEYVAVMDLSYKPHVAAGKMSNAIRDSIATREQPPSAIELDVSFSELGNEGIITLIQALLNTTESSLLGLTLSSRMNRLTPAGVSTMLNSILGDDKTKDDDEESTDSQPPLVLQSLDLGWNNLGPDQTGSKEFLSTLRKLVESDKCPRMLRLYRCGLGPAACRAIGKVCAPFTLMHEVTVFDHS